MRASACATKLSISFVVNHKDNKLYLTIREDPLQEFPTRIPYKNSLKEFPTRIPYKNSLKEFPTRIPYKNSLQEFPTRIPYTCIPYNADEIDSNDIVEKLLLLDSIAIMYTNTNKITYITVIEIGGPVIFILPLLLFLR